MLSVIVILAIQVITGKYQQFSPYTVSLNRKSLQILKFWHFKADFSSHSSLTPCSHHMQCSYEVLYSQTGSRPLTSVRPSHSAAHPYVLSPPAAGLSDGNRLFQRAHGCLQKALTPLCNGCSEKCAVRRLRKCISHRPFVFSDRHSPFFNKTGLYTENRGLQTPLCAPPTRIDSIQSLGGTPARPNQWVELEIGKFLPTEAQELLQAAVSVSLRRSDLRRVRQGMGSAPLCGQTRLPVSAPMYERD